MRPGGPARRCVVALAIPLILAGCGESAKLPLSAGIGPDPTLPPPDRTLVPTVPVATARGSPPEDGKGLKESESVAGSSHPAPQVPSSR